MVGVFPGARTLQKERKEEEEDEEKGEMTKKRVRKQQGNRWKGKRSGEEKKKGM